MTPPGGTDEPITPEWVRWVAGRIITQHAETELPTAPGYPETQQPGRCPRCTPMGCMLLIWAEAYVSDHPTNGAGLDPAD